MGEFAGVASAAEIFGLSRYLAVPVAAVLVGIIVIKGTYRSVEKVFLVACLFYLAYPISAFLAKPDWGQVLRASLVPRLPSAPDQWTMLIGIIGATIAPWMQFYQQSAVVDKGLREKDYAYACWDTAIGCVGTQVVAYFIVVTCAATIYAHGLRVETVEDAAQALFPLAGRHCGYLFAFGLLNASLFSASILPLTTAYQLSEGMGWERGLDRKFHEAPEFYTLYTALIGLGAGLVLLARTPATLLKIMYFSQVLNGFLLPVVLVFMLLLINDKTLMGQHTNTRLYNLLVWACVAVVSALALYLAVSPLFSLHLAPRSQ
jgi:Mn2+/Fe2+ NRAMP family transporter